MYRFTLSLVISPRTVIDSTVSSRGKESPQEALTCWLKNEPLEFQGVGETCALRCFSSMFPEKNNHFCYSCSHNKSWVKAKTTGWCTQSMNAPPYCGNSWGREQ